MVTVPERRLINAAEAKGFIPDLERFAGNHKLKKLLLEWCERPIWNQGNLLVTGGPGEGKTYIALSYLRRQFGNPWFYQERLHPDFDPSKAKDGRPATMDEVREWQVVDGKAIQFIQINGGTETPDALRCKLEQAWHAMYAHHTVLLVDELGELYFAGLEEALRPILTAPEISVIATAQNFHSKRRTDSEIEGDQRLTALLRRFTARVETQRPTDNEHCEVLLFLMREWALKLDRFETLELLVEKSHGIVGLSTRILISAIDAPKRRLTYEMVSTADVDPR
jgi:hypothetical protein